MKPKKSLEIKTNPDRINRDRYLFISLGGIRGINRYLSLFIPVLNEEAENMKMKRSSLVWGLAIAIALMTSTLWAADNPPDYTVGPGDVLDISVWKDEALTKSSVVLPDGKIFFPLIGELSVGGKTVPQIKAEIEAKIIRYVPNVVLSVDVRQLNSMTVYVIGKVNSPGRFMMNGYINVLQALSSAGGLNPFAKKGEIKIFRQDGNRTVIHAFDYEEVAAGSNLEQNIPLKRGDVIVVP
jgi:polysaccharide export outer membrane protein